MRITPVEEHLGALSIVPLRCLIPDRETYRALLLQPDGPIEASTSRVGHHDQIRGAALCRTFLRRSVDENADLVVAPEYCVPWCLATEIASPDSTLRPRAGSIWVLGCESISLEALKVITDSAAGSGIHIHHETISADQSHLKSYVDPLLYVFWGSDPNGAQVLCFVIQFKTTPCRDKLDVEQRSLCLGEFVYSFNRGINSIGLVSIICSDAFDFTDQLVDDYHRNMLLIHIQLNQKPAHVDYARYRSRLFGVATHREVELLCLNWAGDVVEKHAGAKDDPWHNNAGSAYYVPPLKFSAREELLISAHRNGLYYSIVNRWHAFYLNQEPHAILVQKQKVLMQNDPQTLAPTTCLTSTHRWTWDKDGTNFQAADAKDGFESALSAYSDVEEQLKALSAVSPLAVERALELLIGAPKKTDWFKVEALESMKVAESETLRRITVHQDFDPTSRGVVFRKERLQRAQDAATLPGKGVPWPASLKDLEHGYSYAWGADQPYQNVRSLVSSHHAGLVYLSDQSDDREISTVYTILHEGVVTHAASAARRDHLDISDATIRSPDRLCIVYRRNHAFHVWGAERTSRIDRPPTGTAVDIAGEGA